MLGIPGHTAVEVPDQNAWSGSQKVTIDAQPAAQCFRIVRFWLSPHGNYREVDRPKHPACEHGASSLADRLRKDAERRATDDRHPLPRIGSEPGHGRVWWVGAGAFLQDHHVRPNRVQTAQFGFMLAAAAVPRNEADTRSPCCCLTTVNQLQAIDPAPAQIVVPYQLTGGGARQDRCPVRPVDCICRLGSAGARAVSCKVCQ